MKYALNTTSTNWILRMCESITIWLKDRLIIWITDILLNPCNCTNQLNSYLTILFLQRGIPILTSVKTTVVTSSFHTLKIDFVV